MYRIQSSILVWCLAFSVVECLGAVAVLGEHLNSGQSGLATQSCAVVSNSSKVQIQQNLKISEISNTTNGTSFYTNPLQLTPKKSGNDMKTDTIKKEVFHYTHDTAISTTAKIMKGSSEFVGLRFGIEKLVETGAYPKFAYLPPPFIFSKKEVNTLIFQKRKVWTIKPKSAKKQVILYLHGGGYVANLSLVHWDFIQEIVQKTNSILVVPDYPLSPDFTYKELFNFMDELYSWISHAYPDCDIVLMGDSAGGGLALAYAQLIQIRNQEMEGLLLSRNGTSATHFNSSLLTHEANSDSTRESVGNLESSNNPNIGTRIENNNLVSDSILVQRYKTNRWLAPKKIILLSPWLDLGMKNPEAKPIAELDKILSFEVLNLCAQAYLGNKKPSDELLKLHQVSPIYGPYLQNTRIATFVGTHDLFYADSKKLKYQYSDFATSGNYAFSEFKFYEYPQMFHVWMLFTKLPESQSVIGQITEFLNE